MIKTVLLNEISGRDLHVDHSHIIIGGVLVNSFIFMQYLGICPFIGVSQNLETAMGMSGAVVL